jgi:sec-independent protein translocase protein TatC
VSSIARRVGRAESGEKTDDSIIDTSRILARLDELRRRIIISVASLLIAFVTCFSFSQRLYDFLMAPVRAALPEGAILIATRVPEIFMLHLQMAFFAAIFLAAPVWLYHLFRFAGAFLPLKKTVLPVVLLGAALFLTGAAFGHFVLFPYAVNFLTTVGSSSTRVMLAVGPVFSFYTGFILGLGVVFQIPTLVLILSMLNLVTPRFLIRHLRIVILVVFAVAAVLTPTPDMVTQCLLAVPMLGLYIASIGLCWLVTWRRSSKPR